MSVSFCFQPLDISPLFLPGSISFLRRRKTENLCMFCVMRVRVQWAYISSGKRTDMRWVVA